MRHRRVFCQGLTGEMSTNLIVQLKDRPAATSAIWALARKILGSSQNGSARYLTTHLARSVFVFINYFFVASVRKNVELVSKRARLTVPRTVKLIATLPNSLTHQGRAPRPKIAVTNGSQDLGARYTINIINKVCFALSTK